MRIDSEIWLLIYIYMKQHIPFHNLFIFKRKPIWHSNKEAHLSE